jgi:Replication-relaxation
MAQSDRAVKQAKRIVPEETVDLEAAFTPASTGGKLLQWLLRYPLQRPEDWALVAAVDRSTATRQIKQVERLGVLGCVSPALGAGPTNLYYLNEAGMAEVAKLERTDPLLLARAWGADERGLLRLFSHLPRLVSLQNVVNGLIALAPSALAPSNLHMGVNWHWQRDYTRAFVFNQREFRLTADGVIVLHLHPMAPSWDPSEERWYSAFLMLDVGLSGYRDDVLIQHRLEQYLRYRESAQRTPYHRYFPPLLVVVHDPHQQECWLRSAREAAFGLHLDPLAGAIAHVPAETSVASSWSLAWISLANGASCRLQDLLQPMPKKALPPGAMAFTAARSVDAGETDGQGAKKPGVFKGDFNERARNLQQLVLEHPPERDVIALLGLRLGRRYLDVIHTLYTWPLLSRSELAALLDLQDVTAERYLYELRRAGCLEEWPTRFGTRVYLSSRGLRLMAVQLGVSVQHIAVSPTEEDFPYPGQRFRVRQNAQLMKPRQLYARAGATGTILSTTNGIEVRMDEPLDGEEGTYDQITWPAEGKATLSETFKYYCELLDSPASADGTSSLVQRAIRGQLRRMVDHWWAIRHTAGVYTFMADLHRAARQAGQQVRWWESGSRCERRYQDHDSWHNLRPDVSLEYVADGRRVRAWLEWDEGTMAKRNLEPKMAAYATYVRTREWLRDGTRILPALLVVAPNPEQEQLVLRTVRSHLEGVGLVVYLTTANRVRKEGVLSPIWKRVVPEEGDPAVRRGLADLNGPAPTGKESQRGAHR